MNVSIEALKTEQGKYIFCRIQVETQPVFYYHKQKRPHRTHRWMNSQQWRAYDQLLEQLLSKNEFDEINSFSLTYKLKHNVCLQLIKSKVSKDSVYKTLNNRDIQLEDVILVIDCKIAYVDDDALITTTPIKRKIRNDNPNSDSTPLRGLTSPVGQNHNDMFVLSASQSQDSLELPITEATQAPIIKIESEDNCELQASPTYPRLHTSTSPASNCDIKLFEISTESSDMAESMFTRSLSKNNENITDNKCDNKKSRTPRKDALKDVNLNENDDLDIQATPPSTRKRKLHTSYESVEKHDSKISKKSPKHTQPKTDEICHNGERNSTRSHTSSRSSSSKRKKSKSERSKSPCKQEKKTLGQWLTKNNAVEGDRDKDKASSKHTSAGTSSTTSSSRNQKSDDKVQPTKPKQRQMSPMKAKPIEKTLSHEEQLKLLKEKEKIVEKDRRLIENLKVLAPKNPEKPIIRTLVDVSADEMLDTYKDHREELENLFKTQKSQKKYTSMDGVDYMFVNELVKNTVQQKLMEKLGEFERSTVATPKYGDLFCNVLMPEWILRVFMKKFELTRSAAIAHIKKQNEYNTFISLSPDELDKMVKKKK